MGTVPEPEATPDTPSVVILRRAETAARLVIAGHEVGAIRRIALYCLVAITLVSAHPILAVVGLVGLFLLATTDALR